MPAGVARYIYKEITGDESVEMTMSTKERQAAVDDRLELVETFVLACGDAQLIPDMRCAANARRMGSTCFHEFWDCVHEELDSMTLAADERRHGGVVAYLSEVVTQKKLYELSSIRFHAKVAAGQLVEADAKMPSLRWFMSSPTTLC